MGLYINGIEYNILDPNGFLSIEVDPCHPITNSPQILTSDDRRLIDSTGVYITMKKEDE
jgi:hypothetical protein